MRLCTGTKYQHREICQVKLQLAMKDFAVWDVHSDTDLLLLNLLSTFANGIVTALNIYSFHTGLCDEIINSHSI